MDVTGTAADPLARQRRQARGLVTREALVEAAQRCIAMQGYSGASVADIAIRAGLSRNHIFQHYGSKEALGLAALERAAQTWRADVAEAAGIFPQPERQVAHVIQALASQEQRNWAGLACMASLAQASESLPEQLAAAITALVEELETFFRGIFKEARRGGRGASSAKPRQLAQFCVSALLGSAGSGKQPSEQLEVLQLLLFPPSTT